MRFSDFFRGEPSGSGDPELDFGFAFNDSNFSDRVLRIEVVRDFPEAKSDGDSCSSIADWARNRKRRREDFRKEIDVSVQREEQILNCNFPDTEDGETFENQDEDAKAMTEKSPSGVGLNCNLIGNDMVNSNDSSWNIDCSTVLRVNIVHVSSPILAAKSPFFYKLFSNGTRESEQQHLALRIHASEEAAFLDLLKFMYCNSLSTTTPTAVLDVLMAADKFKVASCMRYCGRLLRNLPMTCESALLYLDLPSTILMADTVQPLTDVAKQFLAASYKDLAKFQDEVLKLPLAGIEAVFSSDDLQVASEDAVYDFLLKWARTHYPELEERREVLTTRLVCLIRFPYMTCRKLKKVLTCNDFDVETVSKVVLEALFFKAEASFRQRAITSEAANVSFSYYVERAYKHRPVKIVEFEQPWQQCIVYLDLKREECAHLFPAGKVYSQAFHLGGQGFFFSAQCNMDQQSSFHSFGLFLGMQERGSVTFAVNYEFTARSKPTEDYVIKHKGNYKFMGRKAVGYRNLFGIPWTLFMSDESNYFINGVLHIRAKLTLRK
ncbi:BTB/POZ domain-containing protein [Hibiscus syriacus]|uniref:BTB/POZ domain-containing protein n=1 Tax=Hibiscus syriacus TaxID=106335 RepID=A0A6A2WQ99_HIBSY|nr:BTB/POZ domain-containing protein POB1-like isoform X1 [Hibiscus syriacus]KAE8662688.1 BTB/POZ domain-containing protein [Hibiscus syriacus]